MKAYFKKYAVFIFITTRAFSLGLWVCFPSPSPSSASFHTSSSNKQGTHGTDDGVYNTNIDKLKAVHTIIKDNDACGVMLYYSVELYCVGV